MPENAQLQLLRYKTVGGLNTEGALRIAFSDGSQSTYAVNPHYSQGKARFLTSAANTIGYTAIAGYGYCVEVVPKLIEMGMTNEHLSNPLFGVVSALLVVGTGFSVGGFGTAKMTRVSGEKASSYTVDDSVDITEEQAKALKKEFNTGTHAHNLFVRNCLHYTKSVFKSVEKKAAPLPGSPSL